MNSLATINNLSVGKYKFIQVYYSYDFGGYKFVFICENNLYYCIVNEISLMVMNMDSEIMRCDIKESLIAYIETNIKPI